MSVCTWYAIAIISLLVACVAISFRSDIFEIWRVFRRGHILNLICVRLVGSKVTISQALALLLYVAANGLCMGIGIHGRSDLMIRSGCIASINLIPLFLGGRTNMICNLLRIPLPTYHLLHHWIGLMVFFQSLIHATLASFGHVAAHGHVVSGSIVCLL
jgi:hypothetical protein